MRGSAPIAKGGAAWRRGPTNENGEARAENIGSISTERPPI